MNFDEFFEIAEGLGLSYPDAPTTRTYGGSYADEREKEKKWRKQNPHLAFLEVSWRYGGVSGGSCWDDGKDHHYSMTGDPEPSFEDLDKLLLKVAPNISFLVYRNLENKLVERDERSENEYYGNYTEYGIKRINIGKLYTYLVEHHVI